MLRRLLVVVVPLLTALFLAMAIPLAANIAQRETQVTYLDRLADAERFASLTGDALGRGETGSLALELRRYEDLYGFAVAVVAPDGRLLLASSPGFDLKHPQVRAGLDTAFAGYRAERIDTVWPWQTDRMVLVEPVGRDSGVVAAVVTVSSTERLRTTVVRWWGLLALAALAPFLLVVAAAVPLSRWVLRPVHDLERTTTALAAGRLEARAGTLTGPPELRHVAASFNAMADVVTRTLRRQRTFVSDASHQLRNPLASLRLAVENLEAYLTAEGR
ncbi:MAG: HAMP domain-containing protein, partial [Micromonosporaceae bacterium]